MCVGVLYSFNGEQTRTSFTNPYAQLPVRMRDGRIELFPWGRRKRQIGALPPGEWAKHESIEEGR